MMATGSKYSYSTRIEIRTADSDTSKVTHPLVVSDGPNAPDPNSSPASDQIVPS